MPSFASVIENQKIKLFPRPRTA